MTEIQDETAQNNRYKKTHFNLQAFQLIHLVSTTACESPHCL